ncbi:DUF805 domain-containing protein [Asticcacaulis sp. YBE204]|uniref:DUF805 domain-containing protein n=1 Tax=Asticcacaulis sp. YBE204 TaxID=1282363 RepID=UPI0003C3AEE0|nr:DUF805 domain-containing protein [Asticcacaulis sp. YBE204]ESQ77503.1 hypothetical protein AEYBE204_17335 [Asticcacaulis sp. YBE204]
MAWENMPQPQAITMNLMLRPFARYADFKGRARRLEYFMFGLFQLIVYIVLIVFLMLSVTSGKIGTAAVGGLISTVGIFAFAAACIIPNYALVFRRLHDSGRSGWWILLLAPCVLSVFSSWEGVMLLAQSARYQGAPDPAALGHLMRGSMWGFVGTITQIVLFVFMCWPGNRGANRFGDDPKNPGPDISVFSDDRSAANTARIDDAIARAKAESDAARPPHKPIFDFGPGSSGPMINTYGRDAAPEPERPAPPAWQAPAYDPGIRPSKPFGKR